MSTISLHRRFVIAFAAALAAPLAVNAADWPGFRGVDGAGAWNTSTVLSQSDAIALQVAWQVPIGSGYSGVAVKDKYVVTMFVAGDDDVVAAFDRNDGKELWRLRLEDKFPGQDGAHDGPISTPRIAGDRVFCFTPRGKFAAVDLKTGKELWSVDVVKDLGAKAPPWGCASSPLAVGGVIVLQMGGDDHALVGFDPANGEKLWSAGSDSVYWESPIVYGHGGASAQVLAVGAKKVIAVEPGSGAIAWQFEHGGQYPAVSPVLVGKDGLLLSPRQEGSTLFDLKGEGADRKGVVRWDNRNIRKSFNVPIYYDGHVYAYSVRFLTCLDATTGESVWRSRAPGDGFMILVDGHLIIATKNGTLHVARATPDGYAERASVKVFGDLVWDHPAFADDSVFVRSLDGLARIDIKPSAAPRLAVATNPMPEADDRFSAFIERVESADDKAKVIDEYLAKQKQFPIIEEDKFVHFVYRGDAKDVAVAGDLWGARQERPMKRVEGTDLFYYTAEVEPDARLSYMFIKDFEEMPDPRNPRIAKISVVGKDMEMSMGNSTIDMCWFAMPKWRAPKYFDAQSAAKGRIETHELDSELLGKKHTIDVYVPAGYDDAKEKRYPVAYVHGGGAAKSLGELDAALDGIIGKTSAPVLVVFIHHTPGFGPGDNYGDVFAKEIIPFVDGKYRTIAEPAGRASVGHGFAGFTAISTTFTHKDLVGKVGCQSPYMFGSMERGLNAMLPKADDTPIDFYIEWAKYDFRNPHENWDLGEAARDFAAKLKSNGYAVKGGEVHDGTDWPSWRNRYDDLFGALFPPRES